MGDVFLLSNLSRPHRLIELSNTTQMASRTLAENSRIIHSGIAPSAVGPCASSNGSPLRNSCFARHLNQTGTQHEDRSTSSAFAPSSAQTRIACLFWPRHLGCQPLKPRHKASAN